MIDENKSTGENLGTCGHVGGAGAKLIHHESNAERMRRALRKSAEANGKTFEFDGFKCVIMRLPKLHVVKEFLDRIDEVHALFDMPIDQLVKKYQGVL